jgi:hypothetical protein
MTSIQLQIYRTGLGRHIPVLDSPLRFPLIHGPYAVDNHKGNRRLRRSRPEGDKEDIEQTLLKKFPASRYRCPFMATGRFLSKRC